MPEQGQVYRALGFEVLVGPVVDRLARLLSPLDNFRTVEIANNPSYII
jgi:hypothetical protein